MEALVAICGFKSELLGVHAAFTFNALDSVVHVQLLQQSQLFKIVPFLHLCP